MSDSVLIHQYARPPIIEALVQMQFAEPLDDARYVKLLKKLTKSYDNDLALETVGANIDFQNRTSNFHAFPQRRLSSSDETDIMVVDAGKLTWSRLPPYVGWDEFLRRVKRDANAAHSVVGFRKLQQLGVRYVNRIDIPVSNPTPDAVVRYEDYLTINLSLPTQWEAVNSYAWRFERRFVDLGLLAVVQSAVVAPEIPNHAAFLLDIDVIAQNQLPVKLDDVYDKLEEMRNLKNKIFEVSITDVARGSFT